MGSPHPVTGLSPAAFSAKHCQVAGRFSVMSVNPSPTPHIEVHSFDRDTGAGSNGRVLSGPPLGSTFSYVKAAAPLESDGG